MRPLAAIVLLSLPLACAPPAPVKRASTYWPCHSPDDFPYDTAGWVRVRDADFSFSLPPGFQELTVYPIDSHVRQWTSPERGQMVGFDYGLWSDPLVRHAGEEGEVTDCESVIGGYGVRLAAGVHPERGLFVAGAWRNVRPALHLTLYGAASDTAGQRVIGGVLRTVEFHVRQ